MSLTVTRRPGQDPRLGSGGLSARLRAETRREHVEAESAFALESRLVDPGTYQQLLVTLAEFYLPLEVVLAHIVGWPRPAEPIDIAAHLRGDLLVEDLHRMGIAAPPAAVTATSPQLSEPESLGALYVLAGSALGGQVIARHVRAAFGDDVPVAFFSSSGRPDPKHLWRALQAALDGFGATAGPDRRDQTVQAAAATFRALTRRLDALE